MADEQPHGSEGDLRKKCRGNQSTRKTRLEQRQEEEKLHSSERLRKAGRLTELHDCLSCGAGGFWEGKLKCVIKGLIILLNA